MTKRNVKISKKVKCKDCKKGFLYKFWDETNKCYVTKCSNCKITRTSPQIEHKIIFNDGTGKDITTMSWITKDD